MNARDTLGAMHGCNARAAWRGWTKPRRAGTRLWLATVVGLCGVAPAASATTWGAPQRITGETVTPGTAAVAIDQRANAVVAWGGQNPSWEHGNGQPYGRVRVSVRNRGRAWVKPFTLATSRNAAATVAVAMDRNGTATAIWWWADGAGVQVATHHLGGRWTKARWLGRGVTDAAFAEAPSGAAVVAYSGCPKDVCSVRVRVRSAGGSWIPAERLARGGLLAVEHAAVDDRGDSITTWNLFPSGSFSAARPAKGRWTTATPVPAATTEGLTLDRAGTATVLGNSGNDLRSARLRVGREHGWEAPEVVATSDRPFPNEAALALDPSGAVTAMWYEDPASGSAVRSAVRPAQGSWSPPVTVENGFEFGLWINTFFISGNGTAATFFSQIAPDATDAGNYVWVQRNHGTWAPGPGIPLGAGRLSVGSLTGSETAGAANARGDVILLVHQPGLATINGKL
jgi:hypothetical protein